MWRDWLHLADPLDDGPHGVRDLAQRSARLRENFLAFADTIDGDVLGWVTDGSPDRWPLAWVPRHSDHGPPMRLTLTAALLAWLRGTPVDWVFTPADPDVDLVDQATFLASGGA